LRLDVKILLMTVVQLLLPWRDQESIAGSRAPHAEEERLVSWDVEAPRESEFLGSSLQPIADCQRNNETSPSESPCGAA
jgi:hypothetical protein